MFSNNDFFTPSYGWEPELIDIEVVSFNKGRRKDIESVNYRH